MEPTLAPHSATASRPPLGLVERAVLAIRVWATYVAVRAALRRHGLVGAVSALGVPGGRPPLPGAVLSRAVSRALRIGPWRPRCLTRSLVLYRLLRAQGQPAELVIGLTSSPMDPDAHAWVELDGRDMGPVPGRSGHSEMVRYPLDAG